MPCSDWLGRGSISLLCILSLLCSDSDCRSNFDTCTAKDGRRGYCVAIIYCRQAQSQQLLKCHGKNNYCCPPTSATEKPRRPATDGILFGDEDRERPSGPGYDTGLDAEPIYKEPSRPSNEGTLFSDQDRGRPSGRDAEPIYKEPGRPSNDGTLFIDQDRGRPSGPGYDSGLDAKPTYEEPRRPTNDGTLFGDEKGHRPSWPRQDPESNDDGSPRFIKPPDVNKPRDPNNGNPRDGSGFPDSPRSRRPGKPYWPGDAHDSRDRIPSRRDSPEQRRPENPYWPREHNPKPSEAPRSVPFGPVRSDGSNRGREHRPVSNDGQQRRTHQPKDENSPSHPRTYGRQPTGGDEDAPRAAPKNDTSSRTPEGQGPEMPKLSGCGVRPYELFIAGGEESDDHQWPWMAAILRKYSYSRQKVFLCGGSIISNRFVLTAAHCFVNNRAVLPASSLVVRLGSNHLDSGEEYTVANLILHHNHSGSDYFNDIALLRLAEEVAVTDKIAPICLPTAEMARMDLVGLMATVAGWGDVEYRTSGTRVLQHVMIPIVSNQECSSAYSRVRGAGFLARGSEYVICAGLEEGGKDACLGDSGGPLMRLINGEQWVVVGVVSLGYKCAEPGYYGVYTRVTHYTSWIEGHMRQRY